MEEMSKALLQIKCCRCRNHLSIPPILALEDDKYVCGRCKDTIFEKNSNQKTDRQFIYEKFAENQNFPCRFQTEGCTETLEWNKVEEHERNCEFGKFKCYFNDEKFEGRVECEWKGGSQEYFNHVKDKHEKKQEKIDKIEIWENPKNRLIRIDFQNNVLLVFLIYVDNFYYLMLFGDDKKPRIEFEVELFDETKRITSSFSCQFSNFLPSNFEKIVKFGLKLQVNFINTKYLSIYFGEKCRCIDICEPKVFPKCEICKKMISLPVYNCDGYHLNCQKCFSKTNKFQVIYRGNYNNSYCNSTLTKNKRVENEYLNNHYKCENQNCFFHGNFFELEYHGKICKHKSFEGCETKLLNYPLEIASPCKFKFLFDNIFVELVVSLENSLRIKLLSFRITESKFKYEITIFNNTSSVLMFQIFPIYVDSASDSEGFVEIPLTLIGLGQCRKEDMRVKIMLNISKV